MPLQLPCSRGFLTYTDEGQGRPVLAIHGCPGSVRDWRWVGGALNNRLRLIRVDLPGFGGTPLEVFPSPQFQVRADFLVEALQSLGIEQFIAMGHSAGSPLALELAVRYPDRVRGVALIAGPGLRPHRTLSQHPLVSRIATLFKIPGMKRILLPRLRAGFEQSGFPAGLPDDTLFQSMSIIQCLDFERQKQNFHALKRPLFMAWANDDVFIEPAINHEVVALGHHGVHMQCHDGGHYLQKSYSQEIADTLCRLVDENVF